MFDWNDEELANIVWGEAGESDDHIVPYQEASEDLHDKKEWNQKACATKLIEQRRIEAKTDFHQRKLGSSSKLDNIEGQSASESGTNSWPDLSLSSAAITDQGSLATEVSKNLEETTHLEKDVEIFQNTNEVKEQGDFVNYAWDNIGSFDDLDRIFSNDDPIFGHVNLENSDELWSSKDVSNSAVPILLESPSPGSALRNRSEPLEIKAEYVQHNGQSFSPSFKSISDSSSQDIQNAHANTVNVGYARDRIIPTEKVQQDMVGRTTHVISTLASENGATANGIADKGFGQKNQLKGRKKSQGKQEGKVMQEFYGSWSPSITASGEFQNQLGSSVIQSSPSSILGQQKQIQGHATLYQDITNTYATSPAYGNLTNAYPSITLLPQAQSGGLMRQPLLSGYEVSLDLMNPVNKSVESVKPLTMTPQEKIEKLRRRQQMQAMLAIQKQQKQLGHQVPGTNKSMNKTCAIEMQSQRCDGAHPEQDDSNIISLPMDDHFVEDTTLYMLQDIISKLDVKIRLCIRDSLFRLAQSAMQRNYASDTSSTNSSSREELEAVAREESNSQNRYARIADVETKTNPIDRTVAHLLFHRPLELTGNYPCKLELPISAKMQCESNAANLENFPVGCLPDENLKMIALILQRMLLTMSLLLLEIRCLKPLNEEKFSMNRRLSRS
ncbi:protein LNK2-like isoform X3 [Abrus precatorius]|uniref:Protein LNK2-like isoform X3 n=1 Tax=Abrus precatorius TaxID=3816 RepID=A0A8B8LKQ5_ABRPR|nr:protein LNK2-like isoform X3 [Abrus precatorius]